MTGSTRKKSLRPQIERLPSVRTIYLKNRKRKASKTQKCRCGNGSVAAAFLWPDTEALKPRAFGQNEKVGNSYQNYLPFMVDLKGFEPSTSRMRTERSPS